MLLSVGALALVSLTAGALFQREHADYAYDQSPGIAVIPGADPMPQEAEVEEEMAQTEDLSDRAEVIADHQILGGLGRGAAVIVDKSAVEGLYSSEHALRSEVSVLRQTLDRHEQMLRYIMNRYVEKGEARPDFSGDVDSAVADLRTHDANAAVVVNYSDPESVSRSYEGAVGEPMAERSSPLRAKGRSGGTDEMGAFGFE